MITEEELFVAKIFIDDQIKQYPGCNELETIKKIIQLYEEGEKCDRFNLV